MKEILNLIILIFVLSCSTDARPVRTDNESQSSRLGLKGKVKSLVNRHFHATEEFGSGYKGKRFYPEDADSSFFDINGYVSKTYYTDSNGHLTDYAFFEYDSMNYRTGTFSYDNNGKLVKHNVYKNKYDNNGNIIEIASMSEDNKTKSDGSKVNYKYDEKGNRTESISFDSNGNLKYKTIYRYNANHKVIEESLISPIGKVICRDVYDYDKNGNRVLWDHYYSDGRLVSKIIKKYDDRNNPIYFETWGISDGKLLLENKSKRTYDLNNNILEETSFGPNGEFDGRIIYKYRYDEHQNWIERVSYSDNNKPGSILERKIEYY